MVEASTRRGVLAVLAVAAVLATGAARLGWAAAAEVVAGSPGRFVQDFADRVLAALRDPSLTPEQRLRRVDALVVEGFDLDRVARIALGRYWKAADEAQRREFTALFRAYMLTSYGRRFSEYGDRRLRVVAAAPAGEGDATVETYVEGGATPIRLDWRLARAGDGWRALDLTVEGVSLLLTYRNEFAAVIERSGGGLSGLIGELRTRVAAERAQLAG
jgi:phospholipid transport system substrate-binding protein